MTKNANKKDQAIAAVKKIGDQAKLAEIARHAYFSDVACAAVESITDDTMLFELAKPENRANIRRAAAKRITDQAVLTKLLGVIDPSDIIAKDVYEGISRPPFDWTLRMSGERATKNLLAEIRMMSYPKDRDRLIMAASMGCARDAVREAISKLPYPEEAEALRSLSEDAKTDAAKGFAVEKLPCPQERDFLVEHLLRVRTKEKWLKIKAAQQLPDGDALLEEWVCPYCGALGGVSKCYEYKPSADMYYRGFRCDGCGHENSLPVGMDHDAKDFSVTLREFCK